jgi:hypothetical protein
MLGAVEEAATHQLAKTVDSDPIILMAGATGVHSVTNREQYGAAEAALGNWRGLRVRRLNGI